MSLLTDALGDLAAVDGAYSWAGNTPVGMSDPSGRHPLTDAELASWKDSHKTGLAAAGGVSGVLWTWEEFLPVTG